MLIKNKKQIFYWLMILLPLLLIFTTMNVIHFLKVKNNEINTLSDQISKNDEYYIFLLSEIVNNESIVINNINIFLDGSNDTVNIEEFVSIRDQPTLVFDFSGQSCGSCVDFCIEKLNEHLSEFFLHRELKYFIQIEGVTEYLKIKIHM